MAVIVTLVWGFKRLWLSLGIGQPVTTKFKLMEGFVLNKKTKILITFILSFVITYLIVGYYKNTMLVRIDWVKDVTIWNKLAWYYGYTFLSNLFPSLFLSIIITSIYYLVAKKKGKK